MSEFYHKASYLKISYYNETFEHGVPSLLKVAHKRIKLIVIAVQLFVKPRQRSVTPLSFD